MAQALLIYNPTAGRFPLQPFVERAAKVLRSQGWDIELARTNDSQHLEQVVAQAVKENMEVVFIAGGDGTLNHAIKGLAGSQTALAVLPAGTANVWAKELGLPTLGWGNLIALEETARRLAEGKIHEVDLGICGHTPFLLWASIGLDASVVHQVEPRKRWEKHFAFPQYAATAVKQARSWKGMNLNIIVDDEHVRGNFMLAVVTNIHLYAGGLANLSPEARLDDGTMDLWLFSGESLTAALRHMLALWTGEHVGSDMTRRISFQNLCVDSDLPVYAQVDGEPLPAIEKIDIHVKPKALRVLVPPDTPQQLFT
ncbi:MAG: Diacylglycerol kinase [Chloroflexi bacterium]|nr:Diacylglycerol kinase [Chloroflexota bacterium]